MYKYFLCFCCACPLLLWGQNEAKTSDKLSKKELLAKVMEQEQHIAALEAKIDSLDKRLGAAAFEARANADSLQWTENELFRIKSLPPKNIEVLDLYSFGYQPFRGNERHYKAYLDDAQKEVVQARMNNIRKMTSLLQSKKLTEEQKKLIFNGFLNAYKEEGLEWKQEDFSPNNSVLFDSLQAIVLKKTLRDLDNISRENRWVMLMEMVLEY